MIMMALALAAAPGAGLGAPYSNATMEGAVERQPCMTRYRLSTADPIDRVASFYRAQAANAGVALLDDSAGKFPNYRTLLFAHQPRMLYVVLSREHGRTTARVGYHASLPGGCR